MSKPLSRSHRAALTVALNTSPDGAVAFSRRAGICYNTIRKAVAGDPVRGDVHDRVARVLAGNAVPQRAPAPPRVNGNGKHAWEKVLDLISDDKLSPEMKERAFALAEEMWRKEQAQ